MSRVTYYNIFVTRTAKNEGGAKMKRLERNHEHFTVRLPARLKAALREEATRRFTTPAAIARQAIARELGLMPRDQDIQKHIDQKTE